MKKKIYFAYGSNLNHKQMAYRCPDAEFIGTGVIEGYTMTFKGAGCGVADISQRDGRSVPVGIWKISEADERNLDRYEGFPNLYGKRIIHAKCGHNSVEGMVYIMSDKRGVCLPSERYFNVILQGYIDCEIDTERFFEFVSECKQSLI